MNQEDAKLTLLVRAVELTDREGVLVPLAIRHRCSEQASPPSADAQTRPSDAVLADPEQAFIVRRAQCMTVEIDARIPGWASFRDSLELVPLLLRFIPALALVCGVLASRSWSGDELPLLGLPLYTVLLWNLVVYGYLAFSALRPATLPRRTGPLRSGLSAWTVRYQSRIARAAIDPSPDSGAVVAGQAAARFLRDWSREQPALFAARGAGLLHLGAAAFAMGLALGLLWFGILGGLGDLEPGWRTNFESLMTPERVHGLLVILFAPASALTGWTVPEVEAIRTLRFGAGYQGGSEEGWLYLTMASLVLYVVVPRLALWGLAQRRASRIRDDFHAPTAGDSYYRDLIQQTRGAGQVAGVVWHHVDLTSELQGRTRAALRAALGGRVKLHFVGQVPYGQESDVLTMFHEQEPRERLVVVSSIADTPEDEVQGELIQQLAAYGPAGDRRTPLVVIDLAPYQRFRDAPAFRQHFDDRLRTWKQFVADHGAEAVLLEPPVRGESGSLPA